MWHLFFRAPFRQRRTIDTFLLVLALSVLSSGAETPPTSAETFFEQGQLKLTQKNPSEAAWHFEQILKRHASHSLFLPARFALGQAYLDLGQPKKAAEQLRAFIVASKLSPGHDKKGVRTARSLLAQAHLKAFDFDSALFVSQETLKDTEDSSEHQLKALLVKAWAQLWKDSEQAADRTLGSFRQQVKKDEKQFLHLTQEADRLELELKLHACKANKEDKASNESQARGQILRYGQCLMRGLNILQKILSDDTTTWANEATLSVRKAYRGFAVYCNRPTVADGKKTERESRTYRAELRELLISECKSQLEVGSKFVLDWSKNLPPSSTQYANDLVSELKSLNPSPH